MTTINKRDQNGETNHHLLEDRPSVQIDVNNYQSIIDDPEICEARKRELIANIGKIVVQFIDLGFGVHPVQAAKADKLKRLKNKYNKHDEKERQAERIEA